jgi:ketosteroid isomerase-like protein
MPHPLEATIREAYAAFGRGDVDGYLQSCTEDFTFHVPGRGGISGRYIGRHGLYDLAGKAMEVTGGTFQEEVEDVLANDDHAVVLARHRFTRGGNSMDYRTAHVYEIHEGKLSHCHEQPRDPASFHNAWGSSQD